jgi:L-asparaginase
MEAFLSRLRAEGAVTVAVTQVAHGGLAIGNYAAGGPLTQGGVLSAGDMTFEAAFTKLRRLISLGGSVRDVQRAMAKSVAGEISQEPSAL